MGPLLIYLLFISGALALIGWIFIYDENKANWKNILVQGITSLNLVLVPTVIGYLLYLIFTNQFQYNYVFSHSSKTLSSAFKLSALWEGQEGSFLLWMFWNTIAIVILWMSKISFKPYVISVLLIIQTGLTSMVLGLDFGIFTIGSSPFAMTADVLEAPIYDEFPGFVPVNGNGLNPLLQNYWMVIHPPVIFLGFAISAIPFAILCAAMYKKIDALQWPKLILPWLGFALAVSGIGILMGAYWAYETLNFEGYWSWDPVENAIYIPWLIMAAAFHGLLLIKKRGSGQKLTAMLIVSSFLLVVYSTYLTRSGVLGDTSVHSFTGTDLHDQLVIFQVLLLCVSIVCFSRSWKTLSGINPELSARSFEFWMLTGIIVLSLGSLQVLFTTSIPVINKIVRTLGMEASMAPPTEVVSFYSGFQLWIAVIILFLGSVSQYYFWKKSNESFEKYFSKIFILSFLFATPLIVLLELKSIGYMVLLLACIVAIISAGTLVYRQSRKNAKTVIGSVAHGGLAIFILGILLTETGTDIITLNHSPLAQMKNDVRWNENILLYQDQAKPLKNGNIIFSGKRLRDIETGEFIPSENVVDTYVPMQKIVRKEISLTGGKAYSVGDTVMVHPENEYYRLEVNYQNQNFTIHPRIQKNPQMGVIASPEIEHFMTSDLYTHVTNFPDPDKQEILFKKDFSLRAGDSIQINDGWMVLNKVDQIDKPVGVTLGIDDFAYSASLSVHANNTVYNLDPSFVVKAEKIFYLTDKAEALGLETIFKYYDKKSSEAHFMLQAKEKNWVVVKAIQKPFIGLMWIGGIVCLLAVLASAIKYIKQPSQSARLKSIISVEDHLVQRKAS